MDGRPDLSAGAPAEASTSGRTLEYRQYEGEEQIELVMQLIDNELSEPYSIFTYRYFLHNWPSLCFLGFDRGHCFGTVICKLDDHNGMLRGYLAMLVVEHAYRGHGAGTKLVQMAIEGMGASNADEVVMEAEVTNTGALALYANLGFVRDKRLARYYMNGEDAYRLKLLLPLPPSRLQGTAGTDMELHASEKMEPEPLKGMLPAPENKAERRHLSAQQT